MHYYYGANLHYWFIFPIFWGVLLFLVINFWWRRPWRRDFYRTQWRGQAQPLDIAKRRYAAGDITKEQFEHIKGDLK